MKSKNLFLIFSLFILLICCTSAISAVSDDAMDNTVSEIESGEETISNSNDEQAIGVDSASDADENNNEITDNEKLAVSEDESALAQDESEDKLSYTALSEFYTIKLDDAYIFSSYSQGTIYGTITPPSYNLLNYGFKIAIYDLDENLVYKTGSFVGRSTYFSFNIPAKTLLPGVYDVYAINDEDGKVMAESALGVEGDAVITSSNYNAKYMSNTKMTAKITDKVTGKPLTSLSVKVTFTKGKTKVTKNYWPNSNGQISFIPPVGVGTWKVTITPYYEDVTGSAVKTATVKKSTVSIKAYKVTEYKGFKTTLKALVKSSGKKVKEGKVTFKINGKTYTANVKNGIASVKVKLTKVKTYTFSAKFNGNANLAKSKTVKAKAILKNRLKTKVIIKNQAVYADSSKTITITVKTTSGKNVANGKLKVVGGGQTQYVTVKNGKAKMKVQGLGMKHFVGFTKAGETYKKSITQKFKIKYVPASHKYVSSSKTVKVSSKFRCTCGKTGTHTHRAWSGSYWYSHIMKVI